MTVTSVTFETATIADVLRKAESCAPRASASDHAFGTAAGIMIEIRPGTAEPIRVRSTNLEVFYDEWVDSIEIVGPAADWRIPTSRFTGIIAALPMGTGKTVTFTQDSETGYLKLQSRNTTGQVMMIEPHGYPKWEPYSDAESTVVRGLGERISQISWACSKDVDPLTGILFNGTHLVATDGKRAAMVPCDIPILVDRPVTVPAKILGPIIRHSGDVRVGIAGNHITITPDAHTQIKCSVFDANIPPMRFVSTVYDTCFVIDKDLLIDTIQRMLNITKGAKDSVPTIKMLIGAGSLALRVEGSEDGEYIEDRIDLAGQADHFPVVLTFVPRVFTEAVAKSPDDKIMISYDSAAGAKNKVVRVDGGGDYMAWFVQWKTVRNGVVT